MQFEVEKKFWIDEFTEIVGRLEKMNAVIQDSQEQIDQYYRHPARDYTQTDEVLRLRRIGELNFITYKGPRIDETTKTRQELELPLVDGEGVSNDFTQLLSFLGFEPIMVVRKNRQKALCDWNDTPVEVCLDEIDQLGTFVELETTSDAMNIEKSKDVLNSFAQHLGLDRDERRSYLELIMHQFAPPK